MKIVLRYLRFLIPCAALTLLAVALIIYPERYVACCFTGFALWAECVLPSLFPFMVITLIMIKTGFCERAALPLKRVSAIFNLPPAAAPCFVISIFSGYPAGAKCVAEFYSSGLITADDAKKLAPMCSTSGPLFIIGSVGFKLLGDKGAGFKILVCHILAALAVSLTIALMSKRGKSTRYERTVPDKNVLYNSFYGAVIAVAVAGGFIAFFAVAAQVVADFKLLLLLEKLLSLPLGEGQAQALVAGLLEVTTGCRALAGKNFGCAVPLAGFIITFGGVSILMQQLAYLTQAKVNALYFIAVKFIQAVLCFLLLLVCA